MIQQLQKYDIQNTKSLKTIAFLANWMDTKFRIPGTRITFGLDAILSIIPGAGDVISTTISLGIYALILTKGVPLATAIKMLGNILLDFIISAIPILGTLVDIFYKANHRNLTLLEQHLKENKDNNHYTNGIWWLFGLGILLVLSLFIGLFYGLYSIAVYYLLYGWNLI